MYANHAATLTVNASFGVGDAPFDIPCPEAVARNLLWRMPAHLVLALDPQNLPADLSFQLGDVTHAEKIDLIVEAQSCALVQQVAEKAVESDGHVRYFESEEQATKAAIDSAAELGIELTPTLMARAADTILCTIPSRDSIPHFGWQLSRWKWIVRGRHPCALRRGAPRISKQRQGTDAE